MTRKWKQCWLNCWRKGNSELFAITALTPALFCLIRAITLFLIALYRIQINTARDILWIVPVLLTIVYAATYLPLTRHLSDESECTGIVEQFLLPGTAVRSEVHA